jgi:hypothetical protein
MSALAANQRPDRADLAAGPRSCPCHPGSDRLWQGHVPPVATARTCSVRDVGAGAESALE